MVGLKVDGLEGVRKQGTALNAPGRNPPRLPRPVQYAAAAMPERARVFLLPVSGVLAALHTLWWPRCGALLRACVAGSPPIHAPGMALLAVELGHWRT